MAVKEKKLSDLKKAIQRYYPKLEDWAMVEKAYIFSQEAHSGQLRESGESYIIHPLGVVMILAELELDLVTLAAALLHDVVEDTAVTVERIEEEFGAEVAQLVGGVTKLGRLDTRTRLEEQAENLRKMFLAMAQDIRVVLIKLADRLHNMRTLETMDPQHRQAKAHETLEIFAPLAHRLGMAQIQWELEDLALMYMDPEAYNQLVEMIPEKRRERVAYGDEIIAVLREKLGQAEIEADIKGRAKHFYSIYRKLQRGRDISEVYDLVAVRVIVGSIRDCYGVLGIVHTLWRPLPHRFKDYIAVPKSNMYQSLHTTVVGPRGEPFEIQVRTWEMHRTAEYGIAAHWRYKGGTASDEDVERRLAWLRRVLEWQHDLQDPREFMESLRIDLFTDEAFVYTPKGDVINLPAGSTPLDFAYRIHTEVGHRCVGAKVNGRIVPLGYGLSNGDVVEILTRGDASPSPDWLRLVRTSGAKSKIRQWFRRERRDENLARGKGMLSREIRGLGYEDRQLLKSEYVEDLLRRYNLQSDDDLFVSIGYGGIGAAHVANRLKQLYLDEHAPQPAPTPTRAADTERPPPGDVVRVQGVDNLLVRFSRCCNPVPGDDIVGYVTRGRGVSIHRSDCSNMGQYLSDQQRVIPVSWDRVEATYYPAEIEIRGADRPGLLSEVTRVVADERLNILSAKARTRPNELATIDLVVEIRSLGDLDALARRLASLKGVVSVDRVSRAGRDQ